jgi:hypothetical protein
MFQIICGLGSIVDLAALTAVGMAGVCTPEQVYRLLAELQDSLTQSVIRDFWASLPSACSQAQCAPSGLLPTNAAMSTAAPDARTTMSSPTALADARSRRATL